MQSVLDTPEFAGLNPSLRNGIREAETGIRQVMIEFLAALPEPLRPLLAQIVDEMPRKFLFSQLDLFRECDGIRRRMDEVLRLHQRLVADNPAALPKQ
jgi:hypothetical protein